MSCRNHFRLLRWQRVIKRGFKIAVILRPVSQTGCEMVAKTYFMDFDFDFLAKEKGQIAHFALTYLIIPSKTKIHSAWKRINWISSR